MKITYREENGCLYPNLELPKQTNYTIGKYGLLHLDYIKEHRKGRYTTLVSECRLSEYLHKIDEQAREQLNIYIEQMAKMQNVTEELKAYDPKCWVQVMNNIKENAEESVLREVVYQ